MQGIFVNHEVHRLAIDNALPAVAAAYALVAAAAAVSLRKTARQGFMDVGQTTQLKGLAIMLIVFGHLDRIVTGGTHIPNFAGFGVAVFLFCSGYGLAASYIGRDFGFGEFFVRRFRRIWLPYWVVLAAGLLADAFLIGRSYPVWDMVEAFAGINIMRGSERIEYTRWFITYIILMYVFFFASTRTSGVGRRIIALFGCVIGMDALICLFQPALAHHIKIGPFRHFIMYSLAFPAGALCSVYRDRVEAALDRVSGRRWSLAAAGVLLVAFFGAKTVIGDPLAGLFNRSDIWSVALEAALWQPAFLAAFSILLMMMGALVRTGYSSAFLTFTGTVSYEVFLIHAPLMARHDFLLYRKPFLPYFIAYIVLVLGLSWLLRAALPRDGMTAA